MMNVLDTPWSKAIRLEMRVAEIIQQQEVNGFHFDLEKAHEHIKTLQQLVSDIDSRVRPLLPMRRLTPSNPLVEAPFTKAGSRAVRVDKWMGEEASTVKGPFSKVEWESINLDSHDQIKEYLLSVGWQPTEWNFNKETKERTSPKLTEDSFASIQSGFGKDISDRIVFRHRENQIRGWIENVRPDGKLTAEANSMATPTGRMAHRNVVNVPKAAPHVVFGKQMRELFIASPGRVLVGTDALGLENRCIAHWVNNPDITKMFLEGDFHTDFWNATKPYTVNRDNAKTMEYALFFGAQNPKLGRIAGYRPEGMSEATCGAAIRACLEKSLPGLNERIEDVKQKASRGFLFGIDGRKLWVRSTHSAFNLLVQSTGAILMKVALCYLMKWIEDEHLDAKLVGTFHDEAILDTNPKDLERVKELCGLWVKKAGEYFKLNCPMGSSVQVGNNWAEIH